MALVKFESRVGNLIIIENYAHQILKMIGHSGKIPSALLAEDISLAIEKLDLALKLQGPESKDIKNGYKDDKEPSLSVRCHPFKQLLKRAKKARCEISWR